jgi:hypothetical protein
MHQRSESERTLLKANGQDVGARAVVLVPDRHAFAAGVEYDLEIPGVV